MKDLILGLLDTSGRIPEAWIAEKMRSLTLDYSRFKYFGPVVESPRLPELLEAAAGYGRRWCFVQPYGHVLSEVWRTDGKDALTVLADWLEEPRRRHVLAAGALPAPGSGVNGSPCLLVDLQRWQAQGRPDPEGSDDVVALPDELAEHALHLRPEDAASAAALARYLGAGISGFEPDAAPDLEPPARRFLDQVRRLVENLPRGVFPWNVEGYDDVDEPPAEFAGPVSTLYCVAAGFKPNRILETHGFDAATRVVFFDYSEPGLRFRRLLLEEWDGRDYPGFLRRLFTLLPPSEAHYYLWQGADPEHLDGDAVERRWRQELDAWGGGRALAHHWRRYRELPHAFVHCDLFGERAGLRRHWKDEACSVFWWSNAFFSAVSNWYHTSRERRLFYRQWLDELANEMPRAWLYGASSDNVSVNAVQAREYRDWFAQSGGDELVPGKLHRREIRF